MPKAHSMRQFGRIVAYLVVAIMLGSCVQCSCGFYTEGNGSPPAVGDCLTGANDRLRTVDCDDSDAQWWVVGVEPLPAGENPSSLCRRHPEAVTYGTVENGAGHTLVMCLKTWIP